jgi:hypothetical protein
MLLLPCEPVYARREQRLHGCRYLHRAEIPPEPVRPRLAYERAGVHERPDRFLEEERVAAGALLEQGFEPGQLRRAPEQRSQQLVRRLGGQGVHSQPRVITLGGPVVLILGTVIHEEENPRHLEALNEEVNRGLGLASIQWRSSKTTQSG